MKETGGYFEIETTNFRPGIHKHAIKLNTARNCLEYILFAKKFNKIFIPYYTCEVLLEPLQKLNIDYSFYHINDKLEIENLPLLSNNEVLLYTNYFGIKSNYIQQLALAINNLIIDNAQALFEQPVTGKLNFYSVRKFIGVPDGAFLYCDEKPGLNLPQADSSGRVSHLYKRKNIDASFGYTDFVSNDKSLSGLPLQTMSASTEAFIQAYDFEKNKLIRERNFLYLHAKLKHLNRLNIDIDNLTGPLCYPLFILVNNLKQKLIHNKIYVATYWPNVLQWLPEKNCIEAELVESMVCLPVDQRYNVEDMNRIIELITE